MVMAILARVTRGSITESVHDGVMVVTDSSGKRVASFGDATLTTFARSSCKPIQAIATVEAGSLEAFGLSDADLALFCASHSSEEIHVRRVQDILNRIGLDASLLVCGAHPPHNRERYEEILRAGGQLTAIYSNCSGKHSGMLAYCAKTGTDPGTYAHPEHPLQLEILRILADLAEVAVDDIVLGTDGCGVPVHAISMEAWGKAFAKFTAPETSDHRQAMERISHAMRTYPELVGGTTGRFDTDLMKATNGRIMAKGGAEGFMMVCVMDARLSLVMKVLDGNSRAIAPVVIQALTDLGVLTDTERAALSNWVQPAILNTRNEQVGEIIADFTLTQS
ncbi:asparaginase [Alicyclobacillus acidiphilus]|uniref:asparaginase n=2 Tax=Alicyclobacillus acidiphilus TaxID=182455 RepID=UPI000AA5AE6F|nr:asparaginase [Alicyclobacillus acidiphilus]